MSGEELCQDYLLKNSAAGAPIFFKQQPRTKSEITGNSEKASALDHNQPE